MSKDHFKMFTDIQGSDNNEYFNNQHAWFGCKIAKITQNHKNTTSQ